MVDEKKGDRLGHVPYYLIFFGGIISALILFLGGIQLGLSFVNFCQDLTPLPLEKDETTLPIGKTEATTSYNQATHRGHYFEPMIFNYEYPSSWHVWYDAEMIEGVSGLINHMYLNPVPYVIREFDAQVIAGRSGEIGESLTDVFNPTDPSCPTFGGEPDGEVTNYDCLPNYEPISLDYKLQSNEGYCYWYKSYFEVSGVNEEYITCVVPITTQYAFQFTLYDINYVKEFRHFVESVTPL